MAGNILRALIATSLLALSFAASAVPPRMPPHDYCARDRSFVSFRVALRAAIARRDAGFILVMVSDDIQYSFGDEPGRAGFVRAWGLSHPARSRLWHELGEALRLGCTPDEGSDLIVPAMAQVGDEEFGDSLARSGNGPVAELDVDYAMLMVAVRPGAALRAGPSDASPIVAPLRWDVVTLSERNGQAAWARATLADGRRGYIRRALFRSFDDYRAVFQKLHGRWRMTAFVAGD
jgi:hypothetical protein